MVLEWKQGLNYLFSSLFTLFENENLLSLLHFLLYHVDVLLGF